MGKKKKKKKEKPDSPLDTTMSLGDHLEELRTRLILAILGLVIGTIICLFFGRRIITFIQGPYDRIMEKHAESKVEEFQTPWTYLSDTFFTNLLRAIDSDPNAPEIDPNVVTYAQKIYADTVAVIVDDPNYTKAVAEVHSSASQKLQVLAPADPFIGFMKISLITGLIVSSPWVFYHLWMFVAAGLYSNERKYVRVAVPFSTALFVIGALFFLFVVAPISLGFFLGFGNWMGVSPKEVHLFCDNADARFWARLSDTCSNFRSKQDRAGFDFSPEEIEEIRYHWHVCLSRNSNTTRCYFPDNPGNTSLRPV